MGPEGAAAQTIRNFAEFAGERCKNTASSDVMQTGWSGHDTTSDFELVNVTKGNCHHDTSIGPCRLQNWSGSASGDERRDSQTQDWLPMTISCHSLHCVCMYVCTYVRK